MTAEYKKRAKGGWNRDKEISNHRERTHAKGIERSATVVDCAFAEDLIIRNECNNEYNDFLNRVAGEEPQEEWEEPKVNQRRKKPNYKHVIRLLSNLRYIHKFAQNHASGDVENLRFPLGRHDFWDEIRQSRYQEYRKLLPEAKKLLERQDLPNKIRRQVIEVLGLFNIKE